MLLLLSLAIAQSTPYAPASAAKSYAVWVMEQAQEHRLDPWLLVALVQRETGWHPTLVRHERDGSCSVGLGQINGPCTRAFIQPLLNPHHNLQVIGRYLEHFRSTCRTECSDLGWLYSYNHSHAYVVAIREAVRKFHAQDGEPDLPRAHAEVHVARVPR